MCLLFDATSVFKLQCSSQARPNHHACAAYQQVNLRHYCKQQIRSHAVDANLACTPLLWISEGPRSVRSLTDSSGTIARLPPSNKHRTMKLVMAACCQRRKSFWWLTANFFLSFSFFFSRLSAKPCFPKTCGRRIIIHAFIQILPHSNARKVHSKFFFNFVVYMVSYFTSTHIIILFNKTLLLKRKMWMKCVTALCLHHFAWIRSRKPGVTVTHIYLLTTQSQLSSRGAP